MTNHNYIDFPKAKKALFELMDYYNLTRKPNSPRLSKTHYNTAEKMLFLYSCDSKKSGFRFSSVANIPGFLTKTISLAKSHRCSERCIQRQKERLKELNIIVAEKRLGNKGSEIWFNPEIFKDHPWYNDLSKAIESLESPPEINKGEGLKSIQEKINKLNVNALPHAQCDNLSPINKRTTRTNNTNTKHVDKWTSTINQEKNGVASQQGVELKASTQLEHRPEHQKNGKSASSGLNFGPETNGLKLSNKNNSRQGGQAIFYVDKFWQYAKPKLFSHQKLIPKIEEAIILKNIYESVFRNITKVLSEEEREKYLKECFLRVDKAARWVKEHPGFNLPSADRYFSPYNNGVGFKTTEIWLAEDNRKKIINSIRLDISTCKRKKRHFKNESLIDLFIEHKRMVNDINDPVLIDQFYSLAETAYR